jgi:ATP/maltotriose-dependent transcriptional regulator MalT
LEAEVMLTAKERRVLSLFADGLSTRQISDRLGYCHSTASTMMGRIYTKLGLIALPNEERERRVITMFFSGEALQR